MVRSCALGLGLKLNGIESKRTGDLGIDCSGYGAFGWFFGSSSGIFESENFQWIRGVCGTSPWRKS